MPQPLRQTASFHDLAAQHDVGVAGTHASSAEASSSETPLPISYTQSLPPDSFTLPPPSEPTNMKPMDVSTSCSSSPPVRVHADVGADLEHEPERFDATSSHATRIMNSTGHAFHPPPLLHHHDHIQSLRGHGHTQTGRAMSEPPSYPMDTDNSPTFTHPIRDSNMVDPTSTAASDAICSESGLASLTRRVNSIGVGSGVGAMSSASTAKPRPMPLTRWHTDFVIRIRIPGEGKEVVVTPPEASSSSSSISDGEDKSIRSNEEEERHTLSPIVEHATTESCYDLYDDDAIDESQTSNPFLPSPPASTTPAPIEPRSVREPPSPAPTEIEFPESQDITVDIQRKGIKVWDYAYDAPYVLPGMQKEREDSLGPSASFYHPHISTSGDDVVNDTSQNTTSTVTPLKPTHPPWSSSFSFNVYPPRRAPEIFDQYKAMTEVDYRWTQETRSFPIAGKTLRRLLDMGWLTESELAERGNQADHEALRVYDETRLAEVERFRNSMGCQDEEVVEGGENEAEVERLKREMEVFPWRWITRGEWFRLASGKVSEQVPDTEQSNESGSSEGAETQQAPNNTTDASSSSPSASSSSSTTQIAPPDVASGTSASEDADTEEDFASLLFYTTPILHPFPPAPSRELRYAWAMYKRGYWRQIDRMYTLAHEREARRQREAETVEEVKRGAQRREEEEKRKLAMALSAGVVRPRGTSPGKRRMEDGDEDEMDIDDDGSEAQCNGEGSAKRRRLSPSGDENMPPSSSSQQRRVNRVSPPRSTRPGISSSSASQPSAYTQAPNPYLPPFHLTPPEKQYPAPVQAYNPKIYPDAKRVIEETRGHVAWKGKARATEAPGSSDGGTATAKPLERTDTPIIDPEGEAAAAKAGSQGSGGTNQGQGPGGGQQVTAMGAKTLAGLGRQNSFAEL